MKFGDKVPGYDVRVFNEREVRAAAGILFLAAIIVFHQALLLSNYKPLKLFIIFFLIDFIIRLTYPKNSPSLVLGRLATIKQTPEYSGAPQKRFAWILGLVMAATMTVIVIILNIKGPVNFTICIICLTLLFFEAAFGICIGCKLYNLFSKKTAKHCPGGACELKFKDPIQKITLFHILFTILIFLFIIYISIYIP